MPFALRSIKCPRWYSPSWIANDEVPSDPLADFCTKENVLSIWIVRDDKSDFDRIVSAIAARRDTICNFDYLLFDQRIIDKYEITKKQTIGESPDQGINNSLHFNLVELTSSQICSLVSEAFLKGEKDRIHSKKISSMLTKSIQDGYIDKNLIVQHIRDKLFY